MSPVRQSLTSSQPNLLEGQDGSLLTGEVAPNVCVCSWPTKHDKNPTGRDERELGRQSGVLCDWMEEDGGPSTRIQPKDSVRWVFSLT